MTFICPALFIYFCSFGLVLFKKNQVFSSTSLEDLYPYQREVPLYLRSLKSRWPNLRRTLAPSTLNTPSHQPRRPLSSWARDLALNLLAFIPCVLNTLRVWAFESLEPFLCFWGNSCPWKSYALHIPAAGIGEALWGSRIYWENTTSLVFPNVLLLCNCHRVFFLWLLGNKGS